MSLLHAIQSRSYTVSLVSYLVTVVKNTQIGPVYQPETGCIIPKHKSKDFK